jgi:tRNA A37 threonylcarbamoyladenosine modification protein TsaB
MSLAKGIALAAVPPLPIIGIPTLDVVAAAQPHHHDRLCAVAQAGRRRINVQYYGWETAGWQPIPAPGSDDAGPLITTWQALAESITPPIQIAGEVDPAGRALLDGLGKDVTIASPVQSIRRAGVLAECASRQLAAGVDADPALVAPTYLS